MQMLPSRTTVHGITVITKGIDEDLQKLNCNNTLLQLNYYIHCDFKSVNVQLPCMHQVETVIHTCKITNENIKW